MIFISSIKTMYKIITELNSSPDYDNHDEEISFKEKYSNDKCKIFENSFLNYFVNCNCNCIKSENKNEEIDENCEMIIEKLKVEDNSSKYYTKESNNKSEIILQKQENKNEGKSFWEFKLISDKSHSDFILTDNNEKLFYIEKKLKIKQNETSENKEKIEKKINIEKINDIKEKKSNKIFFISKNKNIFKVRNPNKFLIFNCGNKDKPIRNFINKTLKKKKFIVLQNKKNSIIIIIKKDRKNDADNIRKKIKARFLKYLKNAINERLILAGSEYFFTFLPQNFICNIKTVSWIF